MECNICNQQKHKLYCTKCVKEGVRQQNYQLVASVRKRDEAAQKVKDHLNSDLRRVWLAHAERDEKKVIISHVRQEIDRLHSVIRKGRTPILLHCLSLADCAFRPPMLGPVNGRTTTVGECKDRCCYAKE
jgi:hypothetical protein